MNPALMSANEIRQELINTYGYSESDVENIKGKAKLSAVLISEINSENQPDGFFANIPVDRPEVPSTDSVPSRDTKTVQIGSKEWEEYILGLLEPGEVEVKDGKQYPKTHGLRRIAQLVLGPIVSSGPREVKQMTNTSAMVIYELQILYPNILNYSIIKNVPEHEFINNHIRTFSAGANVFEGNTPNVYAVHCVATAETKAEGRALKKALSLSTHTAEEVNNDKDAAEVVRREAFGDSSSIETKIKSNQIMAITSLCNRLKIDADKLVQLLMPQYNRFDENILYSDAVTLVATLNKYQVKDSNSLQIPEEIKVKG